MVMRHRLLCLPQKCGCDDGRAQERVCRYGKGREKTSELISPAIVDKFRPLAAKVKTLTFDNGIKFASDAHIDEQLQRTTYFSRPFAR